MSMIIAGIGTAVPHHRISQADAAEIAKQYSCETPAQERLFQTLYRRAGVNGRNSVVLDASSGPLEERQAFYARMSPTTRAHAEVRGGSRSPGPGRGPTCVE